MNNMFNNNTKYNILIISHRYYPASNARAFRWATIAEYWAKNGHAVDVLSYRSTDTSQTENKNGVNIFRTIDLFQSVRHKFLGEVPKNEFNSSSKKSIKNNLSVRFAKLVIKLNNFIWAKLFWPDKECFWILPTYLEARKLIKSKSYDVVITVARPFSSHLVGLLLNNRMKTTTWICDIGDPFSFDTYQKPNNLFLYSNLNKKVEKWVFLRAENVSVTTKETAFEYMHALNIDKKHFRIIPPLFSLTNQNKLINSSKNDNCNKCIKKLYYFGSLYNDIRDPSFLLKLIKKFNNESSDYLLNVHFFGNTHDCKEVFLRYADSIGKWLFTHGNVARVKIPLLLSEADILINIGNKTTYQLPSKIIEYISTGKPILNVASVKNDSSTSALKYYPSSLTLFETNDLNDDTINNLRNFFDNSGMVDTSLIDGILAKHSLSKIADEYLSLFEQNSQK